MSQSIKIWSCKIGIVQGSELSMGADSPLRSAVQAAYRKLVGREPDFCFSGWGAKLDVIEAEIVLEDMVEAARAPEDSL